MSSSITHTGGGLPEYTSQPIQAHNVDSFSYVGLQERTDPYSMQAVQSTYSTESIPYIDPKKNASPYLTQLAQSQQSALSALYPDTVEFYDYVEEVKNLLETSAGRSIVATEMKNLLISARDYYAVGRRALIVDNIPPEQSATYLREEPLMENPFMVKNKKGDVVNIGYDTTEILVPTIQLEAEATIPVKDIKRYAEGLMERIKYATIMKIFKQEDKLIFGALIEAGMSELGNEVMFFTEAEFDVGALNKAMSAVLDRHSYNTSRIFINPSWKHIFRKIVLDAGASLPIDVADRAYAGRLGDIFGAEIFFSNVIPDDTIILTASPQFTGRLPQDFDLTAIPVSKNNSELGFKMLLGIGVLVYNPKAVAIIKIS